jgi:protein SCO1/2
MNRKIAAIAWGLAAAAILLGAVLYMLRPGIRQSAIADIGGPFVLASSRGGTVDSRDLAGRPYAIFFGFTHCPEVCPTTLYEMSAALAKLGDDARDLRVFFVTVDPERDTAESLRDYVSNFDPRIEALVPTPEQLAPLASAFRVYYAKVPTSDGGYTMDHTAIVYLMGADGKLAGTISYGESAEMREAKLRKLLKPQG